MPCSTALQENQTLEQRNREIKESLARLERYLQTGQVRVQIGPQGAVAFPGWKDRNSISDVCAYRTLTLENSWSLKQAVMRAEVMSGKKVNQQAIAAGVHTHNGTTWSNH
jgi:hypothetical protein